MSDVQAGTGAAVTAPDLSSVPVIELDGVVKKYLARGEMVRAVRGVSLATPKGSSSPSSAPRGAARPPPCA